MPVRKVLFLRDYFIKPFFIFFYVFYRALFSIELFNLPTLMHNYLFINNMYVTLLSPTCFEH
jgi:hypothetical protein